MSTVSSAIRLHRIFGVAAIVHAGLLMAAMWYVPESEWRNWPGRLWVGLTTLWFFWPIILALHVGSSARRAYAPLGVAAALIALPMRAYLDFVGPDVLLHDEFVDSFSPYYLGPYAIAYVRGWAEAKKHANDDRIVLEAFGFGTIAPGAPYFRADARERYNVEYNHVAACVVNAGIIGHAAGNNHAAMAKLKRRFGPLAAERAEAKWQKDYEAAQQSGRTDAEADIQLGRLAIEVFAPWAGQPPTDADTALREQYKVELRQVANGEEASAGVMGHASGYNEIVIAELERRFGGEARQAAMTVKARYSRGEGS